MDRNRKQITTVSITRRKEINSINQGFFEALTGKAAVGSPLAEYKWLARKLGSQKGMRHPVHNSNKPSQAKKEGLNRTEPFLSLVYQTTLERRKK